MWYLKVISFCEVFTWFCCILKTALQIISFAHEEFSATGTDPATSITAPPGSRSMGPTSAQTDGGMGSTTQQTNMFSILLCHVQHLMKRCYAALWRAELSMPLPKYQKQSLCYPELGGEDLTNLKYIIYMCIYIYIFMCDK